MFSTWIISTIRAAETVRHHSPSAVLRRMLAALGLTACLLVAMPALASDASPDAPDPGEIRALAAALQTAMSSDELLSNAAERQTILSAMRCEAIERQAATEERLARGPVDKATFRGLTRAAVKTAADVEAARERLEVLEIEPLPCLEYAVHHLLICLGAPMAPVYCEREQHVAAQVAAAQRLAEVRP
jgi:hypothetical protein